MSNLNERDRDMSGILFTNSRKEKPNQPDFQGNIVVNGKKYALSAWTKDGAKGSFVSLAVREWLDTPPAAKDSDDLFS